MATGINSISHSVEAAAWGAIIKGVILETTKQKTQDGESLSEPLASYPVIWEILERSDETICGRVPHLIVSSDTESRVASTATIRKAMPRTDSTPQTGEKIWRFAAIFPHSAWLCGVGCRRPNDGGEFGGLALSLCKSCTTINSASNESSLTCKWISLLSLKPFLRTAIGDRNVLLCHSSKKYPLGEHRGQGSLIGGSSWRRILYGVQLPDSGCTAHFHQPQATALMKSFSLFTNKDDTNASAPVAMTRAYTLSIACMMAAARTSGGSLRKIALYGPAMAM